MSVLSGIISHVVSGGLGSVFGILGSALHAWLSIQQQKATIEALKLDAETKVKVASYSLGTGRAGVIIAWAHMGVTALLLGVTVSFLWWTPDSAHAEHVVVHFTGLALGWLLGNLSRK